MSNLSFSTGFRNALLDGTDVTTMFDGGTLEIFAGTIPANADAAEGVSAIAVCDLPVSNAFAASAASGSIAKSGTWEETSAAGGTAAWFRLKASGATTGASTTEIRVDGDCTIAAGGGDLILSSLTISASDTVTIDTFTLSIPLSA